MKTDEGLFFNNFFGEFVQVMATIGTEPIEIYGYILHKDDEFLFMGSSLEKIDAAVRINQIILIQVDHEGKIHPVLAKMDDPQSDSDIQ